MTLLLWKAPGHLETASHERASAPKVTEPTSPDSDSTNGKVQVLHICTVDGCGKRFKLPMIVARHFNANHEDIREDKDSWRRYHELIQETIE